MDNKFLDSSADYRSIPTHKANIENNGWSIISLGDDSGNIPEILQSYGDIIPQFNGETTYEVTFTPGFDDLPYSQSKNKIGPHTEAPVYEPPPRFLALHCLRQAQCGGGYTALADGYEFIKTLPSKLKDWVTENDIEFTATAQPGKPGEKAFRVPILQRLKDKIIFRFSYNQLTYGDVNPTKEKISLNRSGGQNGELVELAELAESFFLSESTPILIPENSVLLWDNWRLMHARSEFKDPARHLTRYWLKDLQVTA